LQVLWFFDFAPRLGAWTDARWLGMQRWMQRLTPGREEQDQHNGPCGRFHSMRDSLVGLGRMSDGGDEPFPIIVNRQY
jgi:hypothetical protein